MTKPHFIFAVSFLMLVASATEKTSGRGFGGMHGGGGHVGGGHMGGGMHMSAPHMSAPHMSAPQMRGGNFGGARPNMGNFGGARPNMGTFSAGRPGAGNMGGRGAASSSFGRNPYAATNNTMANLGLDKLGFPGGSAHGFAGAKKPAAGMANRSGAAGFGGKEFGGENKGGFGSEDKAPSRDSLDKFLGLGGGGLPGDGGMHSLAKHSPIGNQPGPDRLGNNRPGADRPGDARHDLDQIRAPNGPRPDLMGNNRPGPDRLGGNRPGPDPRQRERREMERHRQGEDVRDNFRNRGYYGDDWYRRYPRAWHPRRWADGNVWVVWPWDYLDNWFGYGDQQPIYYDYGDTVVYQDNSVYVDGENVGTSDQYYQQASELADAGDDAGADAGDTEEWLPLGVFAMTHDQSTKANLILQLAVNKAGIIRGNYTATLTDDTLPIQGSVDKKTQRAAWTIGDKKENVIETGIYNLTKDEAPCLVHFGKDKTEQWTLVRLKNDDDSSGDASPTAPASDERAPAADKSEPAAN